MSLRSVFLRSRQLLAQLIKHRSIQNEINQKFADRQWQHVCKDDRPTPISNFFQRYGFIRALPEAKLKGFASAFRRNAAMQLMASRDQVLRRGTLFAFVGISMVGSGMEARDRKINSYEDFCSKIRNSFTGAQQEQKLDVPQHVSGYEFHENPLGNGCNGLIFAARVKDNVIEHQEVKNQEEDEYDWVELNEEFINTDDEDGWNMVESNSTTGLPKSSDDTSARNQNIYPIAIKMAFNFFASSNSDDILREYERELVPLNGVAINGRMTSMKLKQKRPLQHPNIVAMYVAFVDDEFPCIDYILQHHPACLPSDLNPGHGLGRSTTLFVAMKRYDMNLKQYLKCFGGQPERVTMVMLAQLLEGVVYLISQGIAHRDLKSDNILVEIQPGACRLIITDFGCCLAQDDRCLSLSYTSPYVDRGGNSALMAPEIKTAIPGKDRTINYWKSDAWAVGTIAYEIVGLPNPFSASQNTSSKCLDSRSYQETDLPYFGGDEHQVTEMVCMNLLKRNPSERLTAEVAANVFHLFLWQPQYWKTLSWSNEHVIPKREHMIDWLGALYTERCMKRASNMNDQALNHDNEIEDDLCHTFLQRVYLDSVMEAVDISQPQIIKDYFFGNYFTQ